MRTMREIFGLRLEREAERAKRWQHLKDSTNQNKSFDQTTRDVLCLQQDIIELRGQIRRLNYSMDIVMAKLVTMEES